MEDSWLGIAKRLQSIAATGGEFTQDKYDRERYQEISELALTMLSNLGRVPIKTIDGLVGLKARGYDTPKIDVRGAIFRDNQILLVQEESDGLWTLPGGYADVGFSAAENVEKEVYEEAGIRVKAQQLFNVRHKAKGDFDPDVRDFYKLYFICEILNDQGLSPGTETLDARFFSKSEIPPLSKGRVIVEDLNMAWDFSTKEYAPALFD